MKIISKQNSINHLCCFPLETKVRDLDARLFLAMGFVKNGFNCLIGSKNGVNTNMFNLNYPVVYFDKGLSKKYINFYKNIHSKDGIIVALDEEGGVYKKDYNQSLLSRNSDSVLIHVDKLFAWGNKQKKILLKHKKNITADKITVSGHPRFDLSKERYNYYFSTLGKKFKKNFSKYILVNLSFASANKIITHEEEVKFITQASGQYFNEKDLELIFYYQKILLHYFIKAVHKISKIFPSISIVIRPHPAENIEYYINEFKNCKNVIVTRNGSVKEWIIDAQMVIHHDCTTAIEAFLNGRNVYSYAPILDENLVQEVPILISEIIKNEDDLIKEVRKALFAKKQNINKNNKKKKKEIIREIIANVDFEATEIIINEIQDIVGRKNNNFKNSINSTNTLNLKKLTDFISNKMYQFKFFFRRNNVVLRSKIKFPGLSKDEVEERIKLFRFIDDSYPDIVVEQIDNDTFILKQESILTNRIR